jgi:hypothetical protein
MAKKKLRNPSKRCKRTARKAAPEAPLTPEALAAHPLTTALTFLGDIEEDVQHAVNDICNTSVANEEDRAHLFDALRELHFAVANVDAVRCLVEKEINPKPAQVSR